jgi:hypothetical protein
MSLQHGKRLYRVSLDVTLRADSRLSGESESARVRLPKISPELSTDAPML